MNNYMFNPKQVSLKLNFTTKAYYVIVLESIILLYLVHKQLMDHRSIMTKQAVFIKKAGFNMHLKPNRVWGKGRGYCLSHSSLYYFQLHFSQNT